MDIDYVNKLIKLTADCHKQRHKLAEQTAKYDKAVNDLNNFTTLCNHIHPNNTSACEPVHYLSKCTICGSMG